MADEKIIYQGSNNSSIWIFSLLGLSAIGGISYYLYQKSKVVSSVTNAVNALPANAVNALPANAANPFGMNVQDLLNPQSELFQQMSSLFGIQANSQEVLDATQQAQFSLDLANSIYGYFGGEGNLTEAFNFWETSETDQSWLDEVGSFLGI